MYSTRPGYILGFHGCDESVSESVISGQSHLRGSTNNYDWLGNGIYFWENNYERALAFAKELKENPRRDKPPIHNPSVVGAIINLGTCLDLLDSIYLDLLRESHKVLENSAKKLNIPLPTNKAGKGSNELMLRNLDCLVIEHLNRVILKNKFDSVRGVFVEGDKIYPTSGFHEKNHIQLCIKNPNCIKGFFKPRVLSESHPKV